MLHRNIETSEKPLISGEKVFLVKLNSVYLKKKNKHVGAKLKLSIYLRDIFTFDLEKRKHQVFAAIWDGIF